MCQKLKLQGTINFSCFISHLCCYSLKSCENKMFTETFANIRTVRNSACIPFAAIIHMQLGFFRVLALCTFTYVRI